MSSLYHQLSAVYEAMYQTFINYDEEYDFYSDILKKYQCHKLLEIGCGTGNLSQKFIAGGFVYSGMDLSEDMLQIASTKNPSAVFVKDDMRNFKLEQPTDSAIITGRTISYLLTDKDVQDSFHSIYANLTAGGIVCFDCIDARKFIPQIINGKSVTHTASFNNHHYLRESFWKINTEQIGAFDWHSVYFEMINAEKQMLGEDNSTIRSFTKEEMNLFLTTSGFVVKEIIDRPSYAFDTFVVIGEKA